MTPEIDPDIIEFLANMHALYRMYDRKEQLLYIGCTGNAGRRFGEHTSKRWFPLVETIKLEWFPTPETAYAAEKDAIRRECPRYNVDDMKPSRLQRDPSTPAPVAVVEGEARTTLIALLAKGTTVREAAMALRMSKWHARVRLESLRSEGVAKVEGSRRAARWHLVDGDAP